MAVIRPCAILYAFQVDFSVDRLLGLLLALCMTLLLVTPALAGVTDVTGGSKTTVNTVVRNNYTDTHEKKTFALTGKTTTFEGAAGYFGAESGTLTVGFPDLREVEITYTVSVDTVVMTVTNYDDLPDGTYTDRITGREVTVSGGAFDLAQAPAVIG